MLEPYDIPPPYRNSASRCLSIKAPTKPADAFQRHQCLDPQADDCSARHGLRVYAQLIHKVTPFTPQDNLSSPIISCAQFDSMPYLTSRAYESARSFPFFPVRLPRRVSRGDCSVLSSSSYVPEGRSTVTCSPVKNKSRSTGGSCLVLTDRNPFIHCNAKPNATRLNIHLVLSSFRHHSSSVNIPLYGWISLASSGPNHQSSLPSASPRID